MVLWSPFWAPWPGLIKCHSRLIPWVSSTSHTFTVKGKSKKRPKFEQLSSFPRYANAPQYRRGWISYINIYIVSSASKGAGLCTRHASSCGSRWYSCRSAIRAAREILCWNCSIKQCVGGPLYITDKWKVERDSLASFSLHDAHGLPDTSKQSGHPKRFTILPNNHPVRMLDSHPKPGLIPQCLQSTSNHP